MEAKPVINRITIYPVKSLDGVSLSKAQIGNGGCLAHDREFAIVDNHGKFVNGKSNPLVHALRSAIDFERNVISLRHESESAWQSFHLEKDIPAIDAYLSVFFEMPVTLQKNTEGKFLDIPVLSGVTVLSTASLETVGGWFNQMPIEETRKRFRATIEIAGVPAFWEDKLFYQEETVVVFKVADVLVYGMSPRARCIVPTRHPQTGNVLHGFPKLFAKQRMQNLPQWSSLDDYGHGYYLSVDCYLPESEFGKWIKVGDEFSIIGKKLFAV